MSRKFISYLRVSTTQQGVSGLGLDAQREAVARHISTTDAQLVTEYIEVESGRKNDRPVLAEAIQACKRAGATLVIAKLDRLGRSVSFVSALMESGTEFLALDAPFANRLMLHIMAAFAEHEREQIAQRTKAALAMAKARGVRLGKNGAVLAAQRKAEAQVFAENLAGEIDEARKAGATTLQQIADWLNTKNIKSREHGDWYPTNVSRLLARLDAAKATV